MADQEVALRIKANAEEAVKTVGNIKKELREAQRDAVAIGAAFGETSKEAIEAAKRVAALKDQIQDTNERIALFDPGAKFAVFGNVLRTVAGGFSALTGAVALFGVQSEEVEKTLLKVQAALAITEGINTIADAGKDFQRLSAFIGQTAVAQKLLAVSTTVTSGAFKALGVSVATSSTAFKVLRTAIITTGIGALVVGVGFLIEKLSSLKSSTDEAAKAQKELNKSFEDANKAGLQAGLAFIERQKQLTIARAKAEGASNDEIAKIEQEFFNQRIAAYNRFKDDQAAKGLSTAEADESIQAEQEQKEIERLNRITAANEQARQKAEANAEKAREAAKARREKELQDELDIEKRRQELGLATASGGATEAALAARKAARDAELKIDAEAEDQRVSLVSRATATINGLQQQNIQKQKEAADAAVARQQAEVQAYTGIAGALGTLGQVIGQQTTAGKALGIAQAVINTWIGVTEVLRAKSLLPEPLGTIAKVANIATIVAAGFSAVRNIVKVNVPGGGGGGAPSGSLTAPTIPQNAITGQTTLDANSLNQIGNATTRAFVVEADVANNMERVTRLNRAARLG